MKKYLYIFKSELMTNLQYIFDIAMSFIGILVMLFIFVNLWKYIYSDPNELISGYSMNQMIWYIFITEVLWGTISGRKYSKKICNDVKSGNIAYNINKPYSYIGYCLSSQLGDAIVRFVMYIIISMVAGFLLIGSFPKLTIISVLAVIITSLLATVISTLLITAIAFFSFFIEDASPLYWIYSKMILVIGTIFPLEVFPLAIQPIIKYSPIYVVSYGPAKLFVDYSNSAFISIIIAQLLYLIGSYLICLLIYKKGVRKLNVNGG